jgi:hypothetical protein
MLSRMVTNYSSFWANPKTSLERPGKVHLQLVANPRGRRRLAAIETPPYSQGGIFRGNFVHDEQGEDSLSLGENGWPESSLNPRPVVTICPTVS